MKRIIYFLVAGLFFTSCTHRIVRKDYEADKSDHTSCELAFKKYDSPPSRLATKVGEIKLGESGFAVKCSERNAINIMKGEACAINADLINVIEEDRPDLWSSCYRCRAEFYRFDSTELKKLDSTDLQQLVTSGKSYDSKKVQKRVSQDRSRNTALAIGSLFFGFMFGFLVL